MNHKKTHLGIFAIISFWWLLSCTPISLLQKQIPIPNQKWKSSLAPSFEFEIQDTSIYYNIFFYFRHQNLYRYNNVWIQLYSTMNQDTIDIKKEFVLANANRWLGQKITGNIIEHFIPITSLPIKIKNKQFRIRLQHIMRDEPLKHVMAVGVQLQKVPSTE